MSERIFANPKELPNEPLQATSGAGLPRLIRGGVRRHSRLSGRPFGGLGISARFDVEDRLLAVWREASHDLGLRFEAPFRLVLDSGATVVARLLLRNFGATNGMLIVTDYSGLRPYAEDVVAAGFGYSTLSEPSPDDEYDRESFVEMLQDWGWSGPEHLRPSWCLVPESEAEE